MPRAGRLLLDGEASGPWNMGVDEAVLASAIAGGPPTLRLYRWKGPWLSLGYAQSVDAGRLARCAAAGVGVVRRVSGGRAVLHGSDLTYAIAASETVLARGLRASYELVSAALLEALTSLGVDAVRSPNGSRGPARESFDCFAGPASDELCAQGRKLVGSAQRRSRGAVLQHGSIRVFPDPVPARAAALDASGATSLWELGCDQPPEALENACVDSFSRLLGVRFESGHLAAWEEKRARERVIGHARDPLRVPAPLPGGASRAHLAGR